MGLLLSILVSCVGAIELIAFYAHLRRTFRVASDDDRGGDLETIVLNYKRRLANRCRRILATINENDRRAETNYVLTTSPGIIFNEKPSEIREDQIHGRRRSSSPFPTYEKLAPRNSTCSVLTDNPTISVTEVDEDDDTPILSRRVKLTPPVVQNNHSSSSTTTDFWSNQIPIRPKRRSRSRSRSPYNNPHEKQNGNDDVAALKQCGRSKSFSDSTETLPVSLSQKSVSNNQLVTQDYWRRSPSPFRTFIDEDFKNSLDGIKSKSPKRGEFRKKRPKGGRSEDQPSTPATAKKPEPFWVN